MTLALFVQNAFDNSLFYVCAVTTMIVSITLHELAHGVAAIWQGDDTPRVTGHMTPNPLVHMGPVSIALIFIIGIGYGLMPVNPSRFRSKYGDAIVAFAGPLSNILLGLVASVGLGVWLALQGQGAPDNEATENWQYFLKVFAIFNFGLAVFNLGPAMPLDGYHIIANFSRGYKRWVEGLPSPYILIIAWFGLVMITIDTPFGIWNIGATALWGVVDLVFMVL